MTILRLMLAILIVASPITVHAAGTVHNGGERPRFEPPRKHIDPDALTEERFTGALVPGPAERAKQARTTRERNRALGITRPVRMQHPPAYTTPWIYPETRYQDGSEWCWAFVTVEVMESAYFRAIHAVNGTRLAPQAVVDCNPYGYTTSGWWSFASYQTGGGGPTRDNYPYVGVWRGCHIFLPPLYKDISADTVAPERFQYAAEDDIKDALMQKGAVGTAIVSTGKFHDLWFNTGDQVFTQYPNFHSSDPGADFNHVVLIVGWDDGKHAWRIRNTWGDGYDGTPNWGNHGYTWVRYGENGIGYDAVWAEMSPTIGH